MKILTKKITFVIRKKKLIRKIFKKKNFKQKKRIVQNLRMGIKIFKFDKFSTKKSFEKKFRQEF